MWFIPDVSSIGKGCFYCVFWPKKGQWPKEAQQARKKHGFLRVVALKRGLWPCTRLCRLGLGLTEKGACSLGAEAEPATRRCHRSAPTATDASRVERCERRNPARTGNKTANCRSFPAHCRDTAHVPARGVRAGHGHSDVKL